MTAAVRSGDPAADAGWSDARWRRILDRIEHRQVGVGLRFWGPPLWLEVTMDGPDSDRWPVVGDEAVSWDWQSNRACDEVDELALDGAADDRLLDAVAGYTVENLILNAVHEIGEWFRLDGERVFPAHLARGAASLLGVDQGNGSVTCTIGFEEEDDVASPTPSRPVAPAATRVPADVVAPSRFTYLPGATVSFTADGPVIEGRSTAPWRSTWSPSTVDALRAHSADEVELIARDVHRALVSFEADRICRAFHVDGTTPWTLAGAPGPGARLTVAIDHAEP